MNQSDLLINITELIIQLTTLRERLMVELSFSNQKAGKALVVHEALYWISEVAEVLKKEKDTDGSTDKMSRLWDEDGSGRQGVSEVWMESAQAEG